MVDESDSTGVEVCVVTNTSLAREVVATVQTAPKADATAQATGIIANCHDYFSLIVSLASYSTP